MKRSDWLTKWHIKLITGKYQVMEMEKTFNFTYEIINSEVTITIQD